MNEPGNISAGYYAAELWQQVEHTYALGETNSGQKVYFACFGGITGNNQVDQTTLYVGSILKFLRKAIGNRMPGDVFIARCIAQFSSTPEIKEVYDAKTGGPTGFGDTSGLLYGVGGVCHQMCNRILYAMNYRSRETLASGVVWPPSFDASRLLYLNDGTLPTQQPFRVFLMNLSAKIKTLAVSKEKEVAKVFASATKEFRKMEQDLFLESVQAQIDQGYTEAVSRQMVLQNSLGRTAASEKQVKKLSAKATATETMDLTPKLISMHKNLLAKKRDLDLPLFEGKISKEDYVTNLNYLVHTFFQETEKIVPEKEYEAMYGIKPGSKIPDVATVVEMPELEKYTEIGEQLKF